MTQAHKFRQPIRNAKADIDFLKKSKRDFVVHQTAKTILIKSEEGRVLYSDSYRSGNWLQVLMKLRKHLEKRPAPQVERDSIRYQYQRFNSGLYLPEAYAIDLTAAYTYAALNSGFISLELFDTIMALDKPERLSVFGAAAVSWREEMAYKSGILVSKTEVKNPLEDFFFHCAKQVDSILLEVSQLIPDAFMCYYTDCVYFRGSENVELIQNHFAKHGYPSRVNYLKDLIVSEMPGHWELTFQQSGDLIKYSPKKQTYTKGYASAARQVADLLEKKIPGLKLDYENEFLNAA